ncbi:MAG TPA: hypothetical protein VGI81_14490 [Tepidisphaeraceae bacterium]
MLTVTAATVSGPSVVAEHTLAVYQLNASDTVGGGTTWTQILPDDTFGGWVYVPEGQTGNWYYSAGDEGQDQLEFAVTDGGGSSGSGGDGAFYTNSQNINIADATLQFQPAGPASETEGQTDTIELGVVLDQDPSAQAGDYDASQVTWSDGAPPSNPTFVGTDRDAAGNPLPPGVSAYKVFATRQFPEEGTVTANVTIYDDGGSTDGGSVTVNVADAPLDISPQNVSATAGVNFSGSVATFTDEDPNGETSDYGVESIDWGDGSGADTQSGHIVYDQNGQWSVAANHTYKDEGTYNVVLKIKDAATEWVSQLVTDVVNPTLTVNIPKTMLYQSEETTATFKLTDRFGNPLSGWQIGRVDGHQAQVGDKLSSAPATDATGTTSTVLFGGAQPLGGQWNVPVGVIFAAMPPGLPVPAHPATAGAFINVLHVNWKFQIDNTTLSIANGTTTATATLVALDDNGNLIADPLNVTSVKTGDSANVVDLDAGSKQTQAGAVSFTLTLTRNPEAAESLTWTFTTEAGDYSKSQLVSVLAT